MMQVPRALATALVLGMLPACGHGGGGQQSGPPPLAVDVAKAHRQSIATYVQLDGQIAPLQESQLSSTQAGTVVSVYVNEGQHVSRGQLLAKIDDSTLQAQLAANAASVTQAQAGLRSSTLQSPITTTQVGSAVTSAQQQVASARNTLISAQAALRNAKLVYDSNRALLKQGYVSQTTFEQSRATYVAAEQQISVDAEAVRSAVAALATARGNTGQTGLAAQDIVSKRGVLQQSRANVQLLQAEIAQTNIIAPFDGVVTARLLDPGAYASPNQPIVRVSEIGEVYVNVNVPDEDLPFVAVGTPVTFTTSSQPGHTYAGRVFDVNATPTTGTLSYRARVREENPNTSLRGGMLVAVNVRTAFHSNAVVVPRTAVFTGENGASVFTVVAAPAAPGAPPGPPLQKAVQVPVRIGLQTDSLAEVQGAGVGPGTTVIVTRPDALQNGSLVAVVGHPPGASGNTTSQ